MKRILFTTSLFLFALIVYGQGSKVNTAYANYNHATQDLANNELDKAIESLKEAAANIEAATTHEKTMGNTKTWRYRGNIYSIIAGIESMNAEYPDAVLIAMDSYLKANELDAKGRYKDEVNQSLKGLHDAEFNNGNTAFGEEKFAEAISHYRKSIDIFEALELVDSVAYYNGALAADNGDLIDDAVEFYLGSARIDYQAKYCYNRAIVHLKNQEKYEEAIIVAKEAREIYPEDKDLIISQLNVYLVADMYIEAEKDMENAAAEKPEDPTMWFALGVVKDNLNKSDEAESAYLTSLEKDPEYFNSNMNLAILYFSRASKMIEEANEIPAKEFDKYNAAVELAKKELSKAIPYFEKAYEINPNKDILMDLKEAYGQLGDTENYKRVKEIIESD